MKTRNGFVSNSSSSSFVVVIRKPKPFTISMVKLIEFVAKHTEKNPAWKEVFSINTKIELIKEELKELDKDLAFFTKEYNFWNEIKKNKEFDTWLGKIKDHSITEAELNSCRNERLVNDYPNLPDTPCLFMTNRLNHKREAIKQEITKFQLELRNIKKYKDSEWMIYSFEEDVNFSNKVISKMIDDLVKRKEAVIISKYTS